MSNDAELFEQAVRWHQAGQLAAAAQAFRELLARWPGHAEAMLHLGYVLQALQQVEEAAACFEQLIQLQPQRAEAYFKLANLRKQTGQLSAAVALYKETLRREPGHPQAWNNLGNTWLMLQQVEQAIHCFKTLIQVQPQYALGYQNLAHAYVPAKRIEEAIVSLQQGLQHLPQHAGLWLQLAQLYLSEGQFEHSLNCFQTLVQLEPNCAEHYNNCGVLLKHLSRYEEAKQAVEHALSLKPQQADFHVNLGLTLEPMRRISEARTQFQQALQLNPTLAPAQLNLALLELRQGNFAEGWPAFEIRNEVQAHAQCAARLGLQPWHGEALSEQRLLVLGELGVGDEIMFASCLPDLLARVPRVTLACEPRLVPLFARSFPAVEVIAGAPWSTVEAYLSRQDVKYFRSLASLPGYFRRSEMEFPKASAYLRVDAVQRNLWRDRLTGLGPGLKIGFSWRGGAKPEVKRARSTPLECWQSLFRTPSTQWVNLQYGTNAAELAAAEEQLSVTFHHFPEIDPLCELDSFAALIAALDLVISIDNATVHFSGALGVPTWVALPQHADWRWLTNREDCLWYPHLRLIRQRTPGDWSSVFEQLEQQLQPRLSAI